MINVTFHVGDIGYIVVFNSISRQRVVHTKPFQQVNSPTVAFLLKPDLGINMTRLVNKHYNSIG